MRHCLWY